jgi:hypothetical protein
MSKSFGLLYGGKLKYPTKSLLKPGLLFEVGKSREIEQPYRKGRCIIFKVPATKIGIYFGVWVLNPRLDNEDHDAIAEVLLDAMHVTAESPAGELKDGERLVWKEREIHEGLL